MLSSRLFSVHHFARLLPFSRYISVCDLADEGGVVSILCSMSRIAVWGVQCEQKGVENTALWASDVQHSSEGSMTANVNCWRSVCEQIQ